MYVLLLFTSGCIEMVLDLVKDQIIIIIFITSWYMKP